MKTDNKPDAIDAAYADSRAAYYVAAASAAAAYARAASASALDAH